MLSVSVQFKPNEVIDGCGSLYYCVNRDGNQCKIDSGISLQFGEWDSVISRIVIPTTKTDRSAFLWSANEALESGIRKLGNLIHIYERTYSSYDLNVLATAFKKNAAENGIVSFVGKVCEELNSSGKQSLAEKLNHTLRHFIKFIGKDDIQFASITHSVVLDFEKYLGDKGYAPNTISTYLRQLENIYNRAVNAGVAPDINAFRHCKKVFLTTSKAEALTKEQLSQLAKLDLSDDEKLSQTRDVFLATCYTGLNFTPLSTLRYQEDGKLVCDNAYNNTIEEITPSDELVAVLEKYHVSVGEYILPIVDKYLSGDNDKLLKAARIVMVRNLARIEQQYKLPFHIDFKIARATGKQSAAN